MGGDRVGSWDAASETTGRMRWIFPFYSIAPQDLALIPLCLRSHEQNGHRHPPRRTRCAKGDPTTGVLLVVKPCAGDCDLLTSADEFEEFGIGCRCDNTNDSGVEARGGSLLDWAEVVVLFWPWVFLSDCSFPLCIFVFLKGKSHGFHDH